MCFFFFKQKTAYEMRISDWSSDVCSSDLTPACTGRAAGHAIVQPYRPAAGRQRHCMSGYQRKPSAPLWHLCPTDQLSNGTPRHGAAAPDAEPGALRSGYGPSCRRVEGRSEEHKSELQSIMRSSYAVFCL